ncbi:GXYLT [Mytilus edulis]|uniref:UDP-D-xylose:beta-D-glucoside alpha-1,3-D-xylosyltransferase n=1 Tax=Mytilus edulis TaxID=6550 RepID=A0A8S3VFY9_MYTED|nr:GXYLT [Mytilus edulis]
MEKMFKPCATQRLFIPSLLQDVDSLLYVDTDTLFLRPVDAIWRFLDKFSSAQLAALVPEHEGAGNYRFARHPYYGESGLNSGVLLMNLTRIRRSTWLDSMVRRGICFPCDWNYRTDHCEDKSICKGVEKNGVSVLHGSRRVMQNEDQPTFKAVYTAFKEVVYCFISILFFYN